MEFGYIATPDAAPKSFNKITRSRDYININTMTQYTAIPALGVMQTKTIEMMRVEFEKEKNIVVASFNEIKGLSSINPMVLLSFVNIQK